MKKVTCIFESVFSDVLSLGKEYTVIDKDYEKNQIKIYDDKNRARWFPAYCFNKAEGNIPRIQSIWIEAEEWVPGEWTPDDDNTDVIVTFSGGSKWVATFFSYDNIKTISSKNQKTGECLSGRFFWATDMILIDRVTRERIEEVIIHLIDEGDFTDIFNFIQSIDLIIGGLYYVSETYEDKNYYRIVKIIAIDESTVHIRKYKNKLQNPPYDIDPAILTMGTIDDEDGWGVGHLPLARDLFMRWNPIFVSYQEVTEEELEGYRLWLENCGGVFGTE